MKLAIFLLALILFLSSCEKSRPNFKIESDIVVSILTNSEGNLEINAQTEKVYATSTFLIIYSQKIVGNSITIKFKKIDGNGGSLQATSPAIANINIGKLDKDSYEVKFKLNGRTTRAALTINPSKIEFYENGNVKKI